MITFVGNVTTGSVKWWNSCSGKLSLALHPFNSNFDILFISSLKHKYNVGMNDA